MAARLQQVRLPAATCSPAPCAPRYLSLADPAGELGAPNAEPAALLIANAAADALARRALVAAGAVEGLVGLLQVWHNPAVRRGPAACVAARVPAQKTLAHGAIMRASTARKCLGSGRQRTKHTPSWTTGGRPQRFTDLSSLLACHMAAALVALVAMAEPGSGAQRRFVQAGGVEAACQVGAWAWSRCFVCVWGGGVACLCRAGHASCKLRSLQLACATCMQRSGMRAANGRLRRVGL